MYGQRYSYLTRKQANVVYSAIKRGELTASKKWVNELYNAVENVDAVEMQDDASRVIGFMFDGRLDLAQAIIDGKSVEKRYFITSSYEVLVTEELQEKDTRFWWDEVGSVVTVEDGEWRWVIE